MPIFARFKFHQKLGSMLTKISMTAMIQFRARGGLRYLEAQGRGGCLLLFLTQTTECVKRTRESFSFEGIVSPHEITVETEKTGCLPFCYRGAC